LPRSTSPILTEAEIRLMDVLWQRGPSTVQDVLEALPASLNLAYNSVLTTIRVLEKKGYVRHAKEKDGRAHVYRAVVERATASQSEIELVVSRFFGDSHERLVLNILETRGIELDELKRLRKLLEEGDEQS
jgi:BlaI family transcriptional regulator, penicillinase repressor